MTPSKLLFIYCLAFVSPVDATSGHANIGLIFPISTSDFIPRRDGAIAIDLMMMAIDEINNKTDGIADYLLPDIELRPVVRTALASLALGARAALDMLKVNSEEGVLACIGPLTLRGINGIKSHKLKRILVN